MVVQAPVEQRLNLPMREMLEEVTLEANRDISARISEASAQPVYRIGNGQEAVYIGQDFMQGYTPLEGPTDRISSIERTCNDCLYK